MFTGLLTSIVKVSNYAQPTLNNLHRNKFSQGLPYYPFAVNLDVLIYLIERMCSKENKV